jgi:hypothetical protein
MANPQQVLANASGRIPIVSEKAHEGWAPARYTGAPWPERLAALGAWGHAPATTLLLPPRRKRPIRASREEAVHSKDSDGLATVTNITGGCFEPPPTQSESCAIAGSSPPLARAL